MYCMYCVLCIVSIVYCTLYVHEFAVIYIGNCIETNHGKNNSKKQNEFIKYIYDKIFFFYRYTLLKTIWIDRCMHNNESTRGF